MEETKKLLQLYRGVVVGSKEVAIEGIKGLPAKLVAKGMKIDGTPVVARYTDEEGKIVSVFAVLHQQEDEVGATICANLDELNALTQDVEDHLDLLDDQVADLSATTEDLQEQIDDLAKNAVVSEQDTIVITATEGGKTNIDVHVDGETIVIAEGGALNAEVTLTYVPANKDGGAKLELKRADGEVASTIAVADILGNGMLKEASYDKATGILTLVFGTASGEDKVVEVNLKELLDIDDVLIAEDSKNYLGVELVGGEDESGIELSTKMVAVADAAEDNTGLVDAYDVKQALDTKVDWVHSTADRKHIVLANHDSVLGTGTDGNQYNIAMVSKWDVADFGSAQLHMNLNSKDGQVTINDDKVVATVDQVEDANALAESAWTKVNEVSALVGEAIPEGYESDTVIGMIEESNAAWSYTTSDIVKATGLYVNPDKETGEADKVVYTANTEATYIADATSLVDADDKLDAALAEVVSAMSAQQYVEYDEKNINGINTEYTLTNREFTFDANGSDKGILTLNAHSGIRMNDKANSLAIVSPTTIALGSNLDDFDNPTEGDVIFLEDGSIKVGQMKAMNSGFAEGKAAGIDNETISVVNMDSKQAVTMTTSFLGGDKSAVMLSDLESGDMTVLADGLLLVGNNEPGKQTSYTYVFRKNEELSAKQSYVATLDDFDFGEEDWSL